MEQEDKVGMGILLFISVLEILPDVDRLGRKEERSLRVSDVQPYALPSLHGACQAPGD